MSRTVPATFAGLLLLVGGMSALAADSPAAGNWKLTFTLPQGRSITFLLHFSETEGKWAGDFLGTSLPLRGEPKVEDVVVKDDAIKYNVNLGGQLLSFDGRFTKDGKKVVGSFDIGGDLKLVEMLPSKLKNLNDKYAMGKELLAQVDGGNEFFGAAYEVLKQSAAKKEKPEDVRALADRAAKLAAPYGPRWERSVALQLAEILAGQEGFADAGIEQARRAERMLDPRDDAGDQMRVLETLTGVLRKAGKLDEVKALDAKLEKLESRDYADYAKKNMPFKPTEFERKGEGDRAVLVELFTGAECPPCVAADVAFDGLEKSYKPTDVILMQYHLHIPGPDPLTGPAAIARQEYYGDKIRGTPSIFFNGKSEAGGGGGKAQAQLKYKAYREVIDEQIVMPPTLKLKLSADQKGDEITLKANVSDLAKPSESVMLRFAITEERVRYTGGNGLKYHHHVVRALPGGAKGTPLTKDTAEQTAKVNVAELRAELAKYLADFEKEGDEFPQPSKPMVLKNLYAIAFVQDDKTKEVLQAVQIPLGSKD